MILSSKEKELAEVKQQAVYNVTSQFAKYESNEMLYDSFGGMECAMPVSSCRSPPECMSFGMSAPSSTAMWRSAACAPPPPPPQLPSPAPLAAPAAIQAKPQQVQQSQQSSTTTTARYGDSAAAVIEGMRDFCKVPALLDSNFENLGCGYCIRPTILHAGSAWTRRRQKALLSKAEESVLDVDSQKLERNKAFDLLDALTKSGALSVDAASLHIVMVATHCFDKTIMNTLIQDNVNPISKVECSTLVMAETIHECGVELMVRSDQLSRLL